MIDDNLRDRVLGLEPYPDELKGSIREMINHIKERPLKGWERLFTALACAVLGMGLVGFVALIIGEFESITTRPTYILGAIPIVLLLLCWMLVVALRNLKKGTERPRNDALPIYAAFGFLIYMVVGEMFFSVDGSVSRDALAALTIVGVCVICIYMEATELRLRERALRNELALAELTELVKNQNEQEK